MAASNRELKVEECEPIKKAEEGLVVHTIYGAVELQKRHQDLLDQLNLLKNTKSKESSKLCPTVSTAIVFLLALGLMAEGIRRSIMCETDNCMELRTPLFIASGFALLIACICGVTACSNRPQEKTKDLKDSFDAEQIRQLFEVGSKYGIELKEESSLHSSYHLFQSKAIELGLMKNARKGMHLFPEKSQVIEKSLVVRREMAMP